MSHNDVVVIENPNFVTSRNLSPIQNSSSNKSIYTVQPRPLLVALTPDPSCINNLKDLNSEQVKRTKHVLQQDTERLRKYTETMGDLNLDREYNVPSAKTLFKNRYWRFLLIVYDIVCFVPSKLCMIFTLCMAFFPIFCYYTVIGRITKCFCRGKRYKVNRTDPTKTKDGREKANYKIYMKLKTYPFNLQPTNPFRDSFSSIDSINKI